MSYYTMGRLRDYLLALEKEKQKKSSALPETYVPESVLAEDKAGMPTNGAHAIRDLADALKDEAAAEKREELRGEANELIGSGQVSAEMGATKNTELYDKLTEFLSKQDDRYDELMRAISEGYAGSALADEVRAAYAAAGDRAAGHAMAERAGENGGAADSYGAAQANRQKLAFTQAGEEEAARRYTEQLASLLEAAQAAGKDIGNLLGLGQENVDADSELAKTLLGSGESLFSTLLKAEGEAEKNALDAVGKLYEELTDGRLTAGDSISPMQIDKEYDLMTSRAGGGYSRQEALLILWDKYPTMHAYLLEKHQRELYPDYTFN